MKEYFNGFSTQDLVDMKRNDDERKEKIEMQQEIERLKEEYIILQNASDEVEEEKDKEIERLTLESTKWESKFYDEAKKVDKAIEYIEENKRTYENDEYCFDNMLDDVTPLLDILKGSDKK